MGDELVKTVLDAIEGVATMNGISVDSLHPIADTFVNRLRGGGLSDDEIRDIFEFDGEDHD